MSADRQHLSPSSATYYQDGRYASAAAHAGDAGYAAAIAPSSSVVHGPPHVDAPRIIKSGPMFADPPRPLASHFQDDGRPRNIYVLNLPHELSQLEFEQLFAPFGRIEHACLLSMLDHLDRRRGFILMSSHEQAVKVMQYMHGRVLDGFRLDLTWAQVQKSSQPEVQRTRTNHAQRFKPPPTEPESFMPSRLPIPNPLRKSSSAEMWSAMQPRSGHMLYGAGDMQGQTFGASHTAGAEGFAGNQGAGSLELSSVARYRTHSSGDVRLKSGGGGAAFYAQDDQYPMTLLVEGLDPTAFPTADHIAHFFAEYGHVLSVRPRMNVISTPHGELSALVEFASMEDAAYASGMCHGKVIGRHAIRLNALPPPPSQVHPHVQMQDSTMIQAAYPQHSAQHPHRQQPHFLMPSSRSDPFWVVPSTTPTSSTFKNPSASVGRAQGSKHAAQSSWMPSLSSPNSTTGYTSDLSSAALARSPWSSTLPTPSVSASGTMTPSFDPFGSSGVGGGHAWYSSSSSTAKDALPDIENLTIATTNGVVTELHQQQKNHNDMELINDSDHLLASTLHDLASSITTAPISGASTSSKVPSPIGSKRSPAKHIDSLLGVSGGWSSPSAAAPSNSWHDSGSGSGGFGAKSTTTLSNSSSSIVSYENGGYVIKPSTSSNVGVIQSRATDSAQDGDDGKLKQDKEQQQQQQETTNMIIGVSQGKQEA